MTEKAKVVYRKQKTIRLCYEGDDIVSSYERQMSGIRSICFGLAWENLCFAHCIQYLLCNLYSICGKVDKFFYQKSKKKSKKIQKNTCILCVFAL